MSYKLNKTDGTLLVDLIDGFVDTGTTNLTLIGRNYEGFGEFLNENFIKLLENFSNTAAPSSPLKGQLWYDSVSQRLKVYNGTEFVVAGGPFVQDDNPQMVAGDLWINNLTDQLYFFDGTDLTLAGPIYTAQQGRSGFEVVSLLDIQSRTRVVCKLWVGGVLAAVISNITFTPAPGNEILGIDGDIKAGINLISSTFRFYGTADSAENLISNTGELKNVSQFLPADEDGTTVGSLTIQNSNGLTIGLAQNNIQKIVGTSYINENQLLDYDWKVRVRSSGAGSLITDAITVKSGTQRVGIFQGNPAYNLDVTGNCRITGDLIVEGSKTSLDITTLRVEDKNIELGITDGSTLETRTELDDAGIIVRADGDDIKLTYELATNSWKSTEDINLRDTRVFRINGTTVLSADRLHNGINYANGLVQVGTLEYLDVDSVNIDGSTITVSSGSLQLESAGSITVNSQKIEGVANPTQPQDVATKDYVDTLVDSEPVVLSLDITGLSNAQIALIINDLFPASGKEEGTEAKVHTLVYSGVVEAIDVPVSTIPDSTGTLNIELVAVDSNGTQNESAVKSIAYNNANPATGTVTLNTTRGLKRFTVQSGNWTFDTDLVSSVL